MTVTYENATGLAVKVTEDRGRPVISITIPDSLWDRHDIDSDRLLLGADLVINGCSMHVEALGVRDDTGTQMAATEHDDLIALYQLAEEGRFETADLDGAAYVIYATPYSG